MKRIAALTMLRNDEFFLSKWVEYYGSQLGKDNLYIYFDGEDQEIPDFCKGANTERLPHTDMPVHKGDRYRIDILSRKAADLFNQGYDAVIGTDIDEFLIPESAGVLPEAISILCDDPRRGKGKRTGISALGIDVGQDTRSEGPIDPKKTLLSQRHAALLNTRYTKANILFRPAQWGSGFHRIRHGSLHIAPNLYLFHFGSADKARIEAKFGDAERMKNGWQRHLGKRLRTVNAVSSLPLCDWDKWTARARRLQSIIRPIYALNKPAMLGLRIVVNIPEEFRDAV
ncbi:MAG: glycosyltransferase family 2 protein [Bacteroidales bacterium]|nr:glycosyltransferase family 2 protein [Bacteroidales bacterium]